MKEGCYIKFSRLIKSIQKTFNLIFISNLPLKTFYSESGEIKAFYVSKYIVTQIRIQNNSVYIMYRKEKIFKKNNSEVYEIYFRCLKLFNIDTMTKI